MKNFKKREYNLVGGGSFKSYNVTKKHKDNILAYENQIPIDWHEVKIILDTTMVEKYLNNQKSGNKSSPPYREKILVPKIPRVNQNVFSEINNVMVKLEVPDDIRVNDDLSPTDSFVFTDTPIKQENGISLLDSLDKNTFYNGEFIEPSSEDFQCQDRVNFTVEAALKNEVVESEGCYEGTIISQKFKDALKNEELFVSEEFKHEESVPSYENVESIDQENHEEIMKKKTRSSKKKKKCLDCIDCSHRLPMKSRPHLLDKVVPPQLSIQKSTTCKSQTPSKQRKSKSALRATEKITNQESLHIASPAISNPQEVNNCDFYCAHCSYKGRRREYLIKHFKKKHPFLISVKPREDNDEYIIYHYDRFNYEGRSNFLIGHSRQNHALSNNSIQCPNCDKKFISWERMQRHRAVCLLYLICPICLEDVPTKRAMVFHMNLTHPEKVHVEEGGMILAVVYRHSTEGVEKTLELTPFGQKYMEIRKYFLEIESELIKLYCHKCAVTCDKIISRVAPICHSCKSRMIFQCQKCKDFRSYYPHIWRHLTNKNSFCNISGHLPFMESRYGETSNAMQNQERNCHDCEICDFKGTTKKKLYEHVLTDHLNDGIMKNGLADRVPCRFCPTTRFDTRNLSFHIESMHFDELAGRDVNEFLKEAADFRRIVNEVNLERFKNKLRNGSVETEKDYYHKGIRSMLQSVCIECKFDVTQESVHCAKCQASLNFVCLKCDELFSKYSVAWEHATRTCENRSFTLTVGKTFKNSSSSSQEILGHFKCLECCQSFDSSNDLIQHRPQCRAGVLYTCKFCDEFSPNFYVIENHITMAHTHQVRYKDTLERILQEVFEKRRARTQKANNRFDEFGRIIERTFSEDVKLATFSCPKCDETVHKNYQSAADTRTCPKCNSELHVCCKICNKVYFTWSSMMIHFQNTKCGTVEIETYDLDHSYFLRKPPLAKNLIVM